MRRCVMLVVSGLLLTGTQAYAPIQWMKFPTQGLVLAPKGLPRNSLRLGTPQDLTIRKVDDSNPPNTVPYFAAMPDQTISWVDTDLCIEADSRWMYRGAKSGDAIRLNRCTGESIQKWDWISDGNGQNMIQLSGTKRCISVDNSDDSIGASIELRDCDQTAPESWRFESWKFQEPAHFPILSASQSSVFSSNVRRLMAFFFALVGVGSLSLWAWFWQRQTDARLLAMSHGGAIPSSACQDGGMPMIESMAMCERRTPLVDMSMTRRQVNAAAIAAVVLPNIPVQARELASGSGSRVNKDPRSLLRYGLPNQPADMVELQKKLEETELFLTQNLLTNATSALGNAKRLAKSSAILKAVPPTSASEGEKLLASISGDLKDNVWNTDSVEDKVDVIQGALRTTTKLEELIATGYKQPAPPAEYTETLPWLKGRATVAMEFQRPGGKFNVSGQLYDKVNVSMVVDGYTAPITAGNFVDLVQRGFYTNFKIQRSDGFVVQTGDPAAEGSPNKTAKNGFVPPGKDEVRKIPLEVYVKGDKEPLYSATFDDDARGGYPAVLPFNAYGALGMARVEQEFDSASTQWFFLLFDSDLTPAGKNLLDGRYACFGYTVENEQLLADVKEGDIITSAKVTSGLENLVQPKA